MSRAEQMPESYRVDVYHRQTGRRDLTPAQRRRVEHKAKQAASERVVAGVGRHGRLGRRFDATDRRKVRAAARARVAEIRGMVSWARHQAKPWSKRQQSRGRSS